MEVVSTPGKPQGDEAEGFQIRGSSGKAMKSNAFLDGHPNGSDLILVDPDTRNPSQVMAAS
jgi:hypothetical protein